LTHILFWSVLYAFFVLPTLSYRKDKIAYAGAYAVKLVPQILMAYGLLFVLIPHLLNKGRKWLFVLSTLVSLYLSFIIYTAIRFYYFEIAFADYYRLPEGKDFLWRISDFGYFSGNIIWFLFPAVILTSIQYYRHQQEALVLREQKKSVELDVLKNQLNPHFLFNTLNNLYVLALKKSDRTPEVIAKLSEILDYMLYRCNDTYVSLSNEVTLLKNYIALEKLRYGKRLEIEFKHDIAQEVVIAPLLLLTFLENAFKHGVSQEINTAVINMSIQAKENEIVFELVNSIASHKKESNNSARDSIGLQNVRKQLEILYPNNHLLEIKEEGKKYSVVLKLTIP
jgi:sensor histidine kinase YesM